jgi:hypothetical protein
MTTLLTARTPDGDTHTEAGFAPNLEWLASRQGQQRSDPPTSATPPNLAPRLDITPTFRFFVGGQLMDNVESASWDDNNAILRGQLTMRDLMYDPSPPPVVDNGTLVRCDVNEGGGFSELWTMRAAKPQLTVSNHQRTVDLANDLALALADEGNFHYPIKSGAAAPFGHEIIIDVCKRFRIPIGQIYTSKKRMKKSWANPVSPLDVIRYVVKRERQLSGRRLVIRWDRGRLYVIPLVRSATLLGLGRTIIEAAFSAELPPEFASALRVNAISANQVAAVDSKGRKKRTPQKGYVVVESPESIRRFGYVHRIVHSPDAKTDSELRAEAVAYLAAAAKPLKHLTITHTGMPRIMRGDAIKLALGDAGLMNQIVYVYGVHHELVAGSYQVQLTVIFDDPYVDDRGRSILWKLRQTDADAVAAAGPAAGQGSPPKNDTPVDPPPTIFDPGTRAGIGPGPNP